MAPADVFPVGADRWPTGGNGPAMVAALKCRSGAPRSAGGARHVQCSFAGALLTSRFLVSR